MLFFADTYALVEFLKGNKAYRKCILENEIITTRLNLLELYYSALAESSEEMAEEYFNAFLPKAVEIDDDTLKKAAKMRLANRGRNISYVDAIGYELAKGRKVKFLTGDKAFESMPNVEFAK